jgi:hypothetical protein
MNARNRHLVNVLSTGILVTLVALTGLFWLRWHLHLVRLAAVQQDTTSQVQIAPTALFPFEKTDDPNLESPSCASAKFSAVFDLFTDLGAVTYVKSHLPTTPGSNIYRWEPQENGLRFYFDPSKGLMVCGWMVDVHDPDGTIRRRHVTQFAGPQGIAGTPAENLGRFLSPITDRFHENNPQTVYDKGLRCFFVIRWHEGVVQKGPEIQGGGEFEPVQLGVLANGHSALWLTEKDANYKQPGTEVLLPGTAARGVYPRSPQMDSWPVLVLNASGRIDLLNPDTLMLTQGVGSLPIPPTLFENPRPVGPEDVATFHVTAMTVYQREAQKKWAYIGCIAAAVSPDLTGVRLTAFDPNGRSTATREMSPSPDDLYVSLPGASLVTAMQFAVENLYPTATLLLSSLAAPHVPAQAAYRSIVLLPTSFVAMAARDSDFPRITRFAYSVFFLLPAILLGVFLAWRISQDAVRLGLAKRESTFWILGVFALGLPAYVTYCLTRPKVTQVTCRNCGLGRRADFEKCQRCGSAWDVPELTAPAWRVRSAPECEQSQTSSSAKEMDNSSVP